MNNEDMERAFAGRWHAMVENSSSPLGSIEGVKELCHDFFCAAWIISDYEDPDVSPSDFYTWWDLYSKKRGKEKCMKKWAKLSPKERKACIAATPAYVESTPDVVYRKDPITYLNNKSWNDEIIIRNHDNQQQRYSDAADLISKYTG